jgi:hypothetical protein
MFKDSYTMEKIDVSNSLLPFMVIISDNFDCSYFVYHIEVLRPPKADALSYLA